MFGCFDGIIFGCAVVFPFMIYMAVDEWRRRK